MITLMFIIAISVYINIVKNMYNVFHLKIKGKIKTIYMLTAVLLPTWNFLLDLCIYLVLSIFCCGVNIQERVTSDTFYTEEWVGIATEKNGKLYYDKSYGRLRDYKYIEVKIENVFKKGCQQYIPDNFVCEIHDDSDYRPKNFYSCKKKSAPESLYGAFRQTIRILDTHMTTITIRNTQNSHILAELKFVTVALKIPFFSWLGWAEFSPLVLRSEPKKEIYEFVFSVISPGGPHFR